MIFSKPGRENTERTIQLALESAKKNRIKHIVVATCSGETALRIKEYDDINIICVTHVNGFETPGQNEMRQKIRNDLTKKGYKILTTTHVLSGAERGLSNRFGGIYPVEIIAHTLRMFGQGLKVCVEVSIMALDAGLIPYGVPVIAIGGSGEGADTAAIITPAHASKILDTRINEIICKPY